MYESTLPLVTFYLTERCNSRCVSCDYWRHGKTDATLESVLRVLPDLRRLHTRVALLSGGEPLLNPQWRAMAEALRDEGISVWLLTSGLALAKNAEAVSVACDSVTVSLDGTNPATYRAIRGVNAFEKVCEGVRAVVTKGADVTLRVTLQRANFRQLPEFVSLARELGVRSVSFLAVDVSNPHAFARTTVDAAGLALAADDLPHLARLIDSLERDCAADFSAGFIAESPSKLRHIHHYFAAVLGLGEFPAVRCNAPEFSAVVAADGRVAPCFFIPGPGMTTHGGFVAALEHPDMSALRATIRTGKRAECTRCVCSMWRDLARPGFDDLRLQQRCVA